MSMNIPLGDSLTKSCKMVETYRIDLSRILRQLSRSYYAERKKFADFGDKLIYWFLLWSNGCCFDSNHRNVKIITSKNTELTGDINKVINPSRPHFFQLIWILA